MKILLLLFVMLFNASALASAWLPEEGHYKVVSSFAMTDNASNKLRRYRYEGYIKLQVILDDLFLEKKKIEEQFKLSQLDKIKLEMIDHKAEEIRQNLMLLNSFREDRMASLEIEYGINGLSSFGSKIHYYKDEIVKFDNNHIRTPKYQKAQTIDLYYKYKFFDHDRWISSLKPSLFLAEEGESHYGIGVMVGYSHISRKSKRKIFQEMEVDIKTGFGEEGYLVSPLYSISMLDGLTFVGGISLLHYVKYSFCKNKNIMYNKTLYEQLSIAKEFKTTNQKISDLTVSIGFFQKFSLVRSDFRISGPVFSLWFNL